MTTFSVVRLGLLSLVLALAAGCGPASRFPVVPVEGTVTIDGQPAEHVVVQFHHQSGSVTGDARHPVGKTDADGRYKLSSGVGAEGAVPGRYVVTFAWMTGNDLSATDRFAGRRSDPATSEHTAEISNRATVVPPFALTSAP